MIEYGNPHRLLGVGFFCYCTGLHSKLFWLGKLFGSVTGKRLRTDEYDFYMT